MIDGISLHLGTPSLDDDGGLLLSDSGAINARGTIGGRPFRCMPRIVFEHTECFRHP